MVRGLYTSGWSMLALNKKMDVLANNLANVSTTGYKKDTVVLEGFPKLLAERLHDNTGGTARGVPVGELSFSNDVGEVYTYFTQGTLLKTDNSLDMSIKDEGRAFFTVLVPGRGQFYTRDGSFKLNADGQLVTGQGYYVLGENGIIQLNGSDFTVTEDGTIIQNGAVVDRLLITQFQNPDSLRKNGENLFTASDNSVVENFTGTVMQNYLEQSNAEAIREMVDMIALLRSYEANQRVINVIDGTLDKAVNEVGRV
ncbi:flagellar hook-basal body complex protein FlhO [Thermoclostridium stercorarium subsp. stercorarium DSM 8532]|jgi:flagellar basal-body rod protein FlgF|uniref:Flagellar hook-basal body complex protein FlhO n=3 Tax=Thermoclostridium stercorarium TaxID=1510 RepID=L7VNN3_THES1|nr:flagellar basal-body rod protein FlgF [Thermoclostridium stercorarium]AGC67118.1 flagellar hook-basal body complex protein FlhO [Thermoclostridium stercorarium subsp. stercorarium DSM 8532]AGI38198.1 FlgF [Thermoclostridium stercorarium subsp. stercorarium DSM 8532]ANW97603.1 flagellar biosynthesis protein FlgG [Thermoclostridium stercorarium subsp. thermolacticum DSM 2910]ANX00163.1 flagellar biosynthesis protein FlgG [Thermoclostridium stercorarium subsp. leptospartum DSM 9219]UZQ85718.1 